MSLNTSSAYSLANNAGITTGDIACMKLYINGSNQSPDGVSCQSFNDEACSGTECTSSQTKSVSWASSPTVCAPQYAYVANTGNTSVSQCAVSQSTGALSACSTITTGITNPNGIALNNGFAYVANSTTNTVSLCTVNSSTGVLSSCASSGGAFAGAAAAGIAINNGFAYVTNNIGNAVRICTVNATTGALSGCASTGSGFNIAGQIYIY